MKKKRLLIALAVVLGAAACVLTWWEAVWLTVAYRKEVVSWDEHELRFEVLRKRFEFMPGVFLRSSPQVCPGCGNGSHGGACWRHEFLYIEEGEAVAIGENSAHPNFRFDCNCPCEGIEKSP